MEKFCWMFFVLSTAGLSSLADKQKLSGSNGSVIYKGTTETSETYKYQYEANDKESIFLKLKENSLVNASGNCIAKVRPTDNWMEMERCNWSSPSCYFFTRGRVDECIDDVTKRVGMEDCSEITWLFDKTLPQRISVRSVPSAKAQQRNFSFYYEYFNCSDIRNLSEMTTVSTHPGIQSSTNINWMNLTSTTSGYLNATSASENSSLLPSITDFFVGDKILFVLGTAILLAIFLVATVAVIICKNAKIRKLKMAIKGSKLASNLDDEEFMLSPRHTYPSFRAIDTSESNGEDDVYNKLGESTFGKDNDESRPALTTKPKSTPSAYEDVALSNAGSTTARMEMPNDSSKEDTPILKDASKDEDLDTYNTLDHTKPPDILPVADILPPSPPDPSKPDQTGQSNSNEDDGSVYDKLNDQHRGLSRQITTNNLHQQIDKNTKDPDQSSGGHDNLGPPDGGTDNSAFNGLVEKPVVAYEDVSTIQILKDTNSGNYTHLTFNTPKTTKKADEDLYDKVDRQ